MVTKGLSALIFYDSIKIWVALELFTWIVQLNSFREASLHIFWNYFVWLTLYFAYFPAVHWIFEILVNWKLKIGGFTFCSYVTVVRIQACLWVLNLGLWDDRGDVRRAVGWWCAKDLPAVSSCMPSVMKHLFGYQARSVERELAFKAG
jgi:hypothetical protein